MKEWKNFTGLQKTPVGAVVYLTPCSFDQGRWHHFQLLYLELAVAQWMLLQRWIVIGEKYLSLHKQWMLDLERRAFESNLCIHYCVDMWGADRLLFEAFYGSGSHARVNKNDSNRNDESDTMSVHSLAKELRPYYCELRDVLFLSNCLIHIDSKQ